MVLIVPKRVDLGKDCSMARKAGHQLRGSLVSPGAGELWEGYYEKIFDYPVN